MDTTTGDAATVMKPGESARFWRHLNVGLLTSLSLLAFALFAVRTHIPLAAGLTVDAYLGRYDIAYVPALVFAFIAALMLHRDAPDWAPLFAAPLAIILIGVPYFIEPHARLIVAYWPSGLTHPLIAAGHTWLVGSTDVYIAFPGFLFMNVAAMGATGLGLPGVLRVLSVAYVVILALLAAALFSDYYHGDPRRALFASLVFVALSWHRQLYYSPQLMGVVLLGVFFILLLDETRQTRLSPLRRKALTLIIFPAALLVHPLTALFIIGTTLVFEVLVYGVAQRQLHIPTRPITYAVAFGGWLLFNALAFFKNRLRLTVEIMGQSGGISYTLFLGERFTRAVDVATDFTTVFWTRFGLMLFVALFAAGAILFLWDALRGDRRPESSFLASGFVAAVPLLFIYYGGENFERVYIFTLPLAVIVLMEAIHRFVPTRRDRHLALAALLAIFMVVHPVAFLGDAPIEHISTPEMEGAEFFAHHTPQDAPFFMEAFQLVWYHDPTGHKDWYSLTKSRFLDAWRLPVDAVDFVVRSQTGHNRMGWYLGTDPVEAQEWRYERHFHRTYDNGYTWFYTRATEAHR